MSMAGQVAWITGASSGICAALARGWAKRGGHVILSGRDEARLGEVAGSLSGEALILPFDVRDEAALAEATGKALAWKCAVACLFGESSQQPTWPQVRHMRRCSHRLPLLRHSSQPSALGVTVWIPAI